LTAPLAPADRTRTFCGCCEAVWGSERVRQICQGMDVVDDWAV
jgi:hypothetical protein